MEEEEEDVFLETERPAVLMGETEDERTAQAGQLFENFVQASTCKGTLQAFSILCRQLELDPLDYSNFYSSLKAAVSTWKVKALWSKLDKRAEQKVYNQNKACQGTRVSKNNCIFLLLPRVVLFIRSLEQYFRSFSVQKLLLWVSTLKR